MTEPAPLGLAFDAFENPSSGMAPTWAQLHDASRQAERMGFDTIWMADELLWRFDGPDSGSGWWECVAMTGALAAVTEAIDVGTFVLSALHRNPGIAAKMALTLNEVAGGRFVFGFGAGHAGDQGRTFGLPEEKTIGRYEEALQIVMPAIRGDQVDFEGEFHRSVNLVANPGVSSDLSVLLGGNRPRTIGLAIRYGDIWSCFATGDSKPEAFKERMDWFHEGCEEAGKDPGSIGRSAAVFVEPGVPSGNEAFGRTISGSTDEIVADLGELFEMGYSRVEIFPARGVVAGLDELEPIVTAFGG